VHFFWSDPRISKFLCSAVINSYTRLKDVFIQLACKLGISLKNLDNRNTDILGQSNANLKKKSTY
jgi:hypothetical protein